MWWSVGLVKYCGKDAFWFHIEYHCHLFFEKKKETWYNTWQIQRCTFQWKRVKNAVFRGQLLMYFFEGHPNLDSWNKHSPLENVKISDGPSTNVVKLGIVYRSISIYSIIWLYTSHGPISVDSKFSLYIYFSATVLGVPEILPNQCVSKVDPLKAVPPRPCLCLLAHAPTSVPV